MDLFVLLTRHLKVERKHQELLFDLLTDERAAIIALDKDMLPPLSEKKEALLRKAQAIEAKRNKIISDLAEAADKKTPLKLAEIIELCPKNGTAAELEKEGKELKEKALQVQKLFSQNSRLIRETQGVVTTTLAILTAKPESDLPTYGQNGRLTSDREEPTLTGRLGGIKQEA